MQPASSDSLIGRDRELEQLRKLLHAVAHGATATAFIEGEAGIGKTRLLRGLTDEAQASGLTVLRGAAHPLERNRPFGPLADALGLRPNAKDPRRAALGRLLTGEDVVLAPGPAAGQLVFRAIEEILDMLERASDAGPVLLALDDLHWAEGSTLLAINWMTRRLTEIPLLLVATLRPEPRSPELSQLLDDARRSGAQLIPLAALSAREVEVLVETELGLPPGRSLALAVERAAGNPLWVVELLRALSTEGSLDLSGDRAEAVSSDLPDSVRQLVLRRLGFLAEQTVAALRTASLFGEAFSLTDMATVTGRRVTDLVDDLGPAFQAQLVADHRGVLVFRHQLVRDAIYEEIPEAARLALHRETAAALAAAGAPLGKVASQLILGSRPPDPEAAGQLRHAAREAAPSSPGVAAQLLQRADELLPPGHPERDFVLAELTDSLTLSGRSREATALAEAVLARPHAAAIDHPLRLTLIAVLSLQLRAEELIVHAQRALDRSPDIPPRDQAVILGLSSFGRQFGGDLPGAEQDALRGLEIAERAGDQAMTSWNLTALAGALDNQGRYIEAVEVSTRAVDVAFDPPDLDARLRHPHMVQGIALCDADRLDDAATALRAAAEECAALQSDQLLADIQLLAAQVPLLRGEWDEAVPQIEGGIEFAREHGNLITLPRFQAYLALVAAVCGDDAAAARALAPFAAELAGEASCYGVEFLFYAAAVRAELGGDPAAALAHLERFWHVGMAPASRNGHRFIAPATVRLALALGSPSLAHEAATQAGEAAALAGDVPSVRSAALRCQGLLEGDADGMLDAVSLARRSGRVLDHGGACEDAAAVLAGHGHDERARSLLGEAIDRYEALGATRLTARATARLRELGGHRGSRGGRQRALTGWESLTRSERSVAELVAQGLTNREVGTRLYISPHTVNSHLRHAFQKLDVSTRTALAAKFTHSSDVSAEPSTQTGPRTVNQ